MKDNPRGDRQQTSTPGQSSPTTEFIKFIPLGANKEPEIFAEGVLNGKVNYFSGNDPEKWKTNIPTWQSVVYEDIYDGIDMKFYGNNRQMEYGIIVKPGASPSRVQLAYQGIEGLQITEEGNLEIALKEGKIIHKKPYVYQEIDGKRVEREGSFRVQDIKPLSRNRKQVVYGFEVASYDKKYPLVIDPVLVYSTFLGGSGNDVAHDIAIDSIGNVYITGTTYSTDFPMVSALYGKQQISICDAFVTKINATGTEIVYSTYLGGPGINEITQGIGIAADSAGNAYVTGYTSAYAFPTTADAFDRSFNGWFDAFVTKINPSGSSLVYSTYLGGTAEDVGFAIDLDTPGNIYVVGHTNSTDFPTVSPLFNSNSGATDVFVTKIDAAGTNLSYSTYLGGNVNEDPSDIAIDTFGNIYITGITGSYNFPLAVPFQNSFFGNNSVFITKINTAGTSLVFSTFLGGRAGWEGGHGIAVDTEGNVYVVGGTHSDNFPMVSAMDASLNGSGDAFVVKLNPPGTSILFSTYLGGLGEDEGYSIALDADRNVYVTGKTASSNFPTLNPISTINSGGDDVFITKFDTDGNLLYSTYLGGSSNDDGRGIAVDTVGNAYITGVTQSSDFPTVSPIYGSNSGGNDVFVAKIGHDNLRPIVDAGPDQSIEQADASGAQVTLDGTGSSDPDNDPLTYVWTGPFGNATGHTPTVTMPPGVNVVYLVVNDGTIDSEPDAVTITVAHAQSFPEGMVSYWKFDEGNGTIASDSVGTNGGSIYGGTWIESIVGSALFFDGVNDYVTVANETNFDFERTSSLTIEAWIQTPSGNHGTVILSKQHATPDYRGYGFDVIGTPSVIRFSLLSDWAAGNYIQIKGSTVLNDGQWHHVVATYNGNSSASGVELYVDGNLETKTVINDSLSSTILNDKPLRLGTWEYLSYYWHGIIDEVAIYNKAMTLEEAQEHYQKGQQGLGYLDNLNGQPITDAGPDQSPHVTEVVTLNGAGSTDVDGDLLTYTWAFTTKPAGSAATLSDAHAVNPTFTVDKAGTYVVSLIINDGTVDSQPDTVTISTLNSAPVAEAGTDQFVYVNNPVTLDSSGSTDVDGDPLMYTWAFTSKPAGSAAMLSEEDAKLVNPTFTADKAGTYVVSLIVNDGTVNSQPDTVVISTINTVPIAEAGPDQSIILIGSTVQLDGSQSYDLEGDVITYLWAFTSIPAGSNATLSNVDTTTPTFVADVRGEYVIQLVVMDDILQSTPNTVLVSFENVKPVANAGTGQSVYVGDTVTLDGSGSTDANGDTLAYVWALTSVPAGSSSTIANSTNSETSFVPDVAGTYVVQLVVNDGTVDSGSGYYCHTGIIGADRCYRGCSGLHNPGVVARSQCIQERQHAEDHD